MNLPFRCIFGDMNFLFLYVFKFTQFNLFLNTRGIHLILTVVFLLNLSLYAKVYIFCLVCY